MQSKNAEEEKVSFNWDERREYVENERHRVKASTENPQKKKKKNSKQKETGKGSMGEKTIAVISKTM